MQKGFSVSYDKWTRHGESSDEDEYGKNSSDEKDLNDVPDDDEYDTRHDGFFVNRGKLERASLAAKYLVEFQKASRIRVNIFVASFEISFEEQLSMLDSVNFKVNKEEDDKIRTTTANVTARSERVLCRKLKVRLTRHSNSPPKCGRWPSPVSNFLRGLRMIIKIYLSRLLLFDATMIIL
ncbi:hypothetical protein Tco_0624902, partial [Tanacetum coccineum]